MEKEEDRDDKEKEKETSAVFGMQFTYEDIGKGWKSFVDIEKCLIWKLDWHGPQLALFALTSHACYKKITTEDNKIFIHNQKFILRPKLYIEMVYTHSGNEEGFKAMRSAMHPYSSKEEHWGLFILPFVGLLKSKLEALQINIAFRGVVLRDFKEHVPEDSAE